MLFIACWLIGAAISWAGVLVYGKYLHNFTWEETFEAIKQCKGSFAEEAVKVVLYILIWPIEIAAIIYQWLYMKIMTRRVIKNFSMLDKWES